MDEGSSPSMTPTGSYNTAAGLRSLIQKMQLREDALHRLVSSHACGKSLAHGQGQRGSYRREETGRGQFEDMVTSWEAEEKEKPQGLSRTQFGGLSLPLFPAWFECACTWEVGVRLMRKYSQQEGTPFCQSLAPSLKAAFIRTYITRTHWLQVNFISLVGCMIIYLYSIYDRVSGYTSFMSKSSQSPSVFLCHVSKIGSVDFHLYCLQSELRSQLMYLKFFCGLINDQFPSPPSPLPSFSSLFFILVGGKLFILCG